MVGRFEELGRDNRGGHFDADGATDLAISGVEDSGHIGLVLLRRSPPGGLPGIQDDDAVRQVFRDGYAADLDGVLMPLPPLDDGIRHACPIPPC